MYDDAAGIYTALASHLEEAIGDNNYGGAFYSYGAATGGKTNTGVLAYASRQQIISDLKLMYPQQLQV